MNELTKNDETENSPLPFTAKRDEILCALLVYAAAYLYVSTVFMLAPKWLWLIVAAILVVCTEMLNKGRKPLTETYIWLGCFAVCVISWAFRISSVWNRDQLFLFVHGFCVWWVLSRSGALLEGESGHLLPADAFNGVIRIPFGNFFLGIRTLIYGLKSQKKKEKTAGKRGLWILLAAALCAVLFIRAASLLSSADSDFGAYLENFLAWFRFEIDEDIAVKIILSIPVWFWLYGLVGGVRRFDKETADRQRSGIYSFLEKIRTVPTLFWGIAVGLFSVLYLVFFFVQGEYLFGAFTRTLPEGFIVSEYARQGFFELCRVMAVNFLVLWLVTRMNDNGENGSKVIKVVCAVLLAESMIFAVIAFSKLALYISCFGFTPKRLESTWLVCVLFAGCIAWMVNIFTGKKVIRLWMYFAAISLTVLALI